MCSTSAWMLLTSIQAGWTQDAIENAVLQSLNDGTNDHAWIGAWLVHQLLGHVRVQFGHLPHHSSQKCALTPGMPAQPPGALLVKERRRSLLLRCAPETQAALRLLPGAALATPAHLPAAAKRGNNGFNVRRL